MLRQKSLEGLEMWAGKCIIVEGVKEKGKLETRIYYELFPPCQVFFPPDNLPYQVKVFV